MAPEPPEPPKNPKPSKPPHNNSWTLGDFQGNRLYGTKRFWLLYVHANVAGAYPAEYSSAVTGKIRANLANLFALVKAFSSTTNSSSEGVAPLGAVFGGGAFEASVPSDIVISAKKLPPDGGAPAAPAVIADGQKFDNEGKYYLDFSVGVPIKKVSQLSFDSTKNTVSPTSLSDRKALALVDLHVPPIDVKSPGFTLIPYLVSGISIQKQPLHQILLGAGWGPQFANFYLGALWVKQPDATSAASGTSKSSYAPQFAFGINITVSSFTNIKK
jgi:hypothetical protein